MKIAKLFINPEQLQFGLMAIEGEKGYKEWGLLQTMRFVNWVNARA